VLWLFVLASVASSVIGSYAVWYVLNRERRRRVVMVAAITIAIAVWVAMAALRVASADLATKTLWYRLEFAERMGVFYQKSMCEISARNGGPVRLLEHSDSIGG
jgi:hypothetical protein